MICNEILGLLEDENTPATVYIEPNDDVNQLTGEASADEDDGGLIDNLSGRQLRAPAEAVFRDGRRTTENDGENAEPVSTSNTHFNRYKTAKWSHGTSLRLTDCMFPESNYAKYRDFSPVQLFELFFDDEVWNMIVDQTIVYAKFRGETEFMVTKEDIKVFLVF